MRRRLRGIELELSAAFRRLGALYAEIPEPYRPDVCGERWAELEREIDCACAAGDYDGALRAIQRWEQHGGRVLSRALMYAPLPGPEPRPVGGEAS